MLHHSDTVFLTVVEPPLVAGDLPVVLARLRASWPPERLVDLLASPVAAVVKTAATCLGITGSMPGCEHLVSALRHADEQVASAAEDALWNIWMRAGSGEACTQLCVAIQRLQQDEVEAALHLLEGLVASEGSFAEAHHQQAIALHALERYDEAEAAYQRTIALNPHHFAAVAGLGHICVQRGDFAGALRHYRHALRVHPRLAEIRKIVPELEAAIQKRIVA